ncbi:hypothetical protein, partial [Methyloglobulus sp.]|uniref:hypothetical protein n=1 Tax=Methyloglobulus sp. TaxID=2518622 RepID=UPI003988D539
PFQQRSRRDPGQFRHKTIRTLAKRTQNHCKRTPDGRIGLLPSVPVNKITTAILALVTPLPTDNAVFNNRALITMLADNHQNAPFLVAS